MTVQLVAKSGPSQSTARQPEIRPAKRVHAMGMRSWRPKASRYLSLALPLWLWRLPLRAAQQANVVSACGSMIATPLGALTARAGNPFPAITDVNGRLCLSSPSLTAVVDAMSDKLNLLEARLKKLEDRK